VLRCAGRSLHNGTRQTDCTPLPDHYSIRSSRIGGTDQGTQIVGILDAIEHYDEAVRSLVMFEQHIDIGVLLGAGDRNYSLVSVSLGCAVKLLSRKEAELNSTGATGFDNSLNSLVMTFARYTHIVEAARARLKGLADRMDSKNDNHRIQVYDTRQREISPPCVRETKEVAEAGRVTLVEPSIYTRCCFTGARMSISAVIVDDEQLARDELTYLLKEVDVDVLAQGKNGVEAVNLIKELSPDLVFLDVQMPGLDGFGVIKKLLDRKVPLPQIVFATAFDQYAVKAFEVNAVDYLLKPFDKKRVAQAVEKAKKKLESAGSSNEQLGTLVKMLEQQQRPQAAKVLLKSAGRLFLVDQKDICYASIEDGIITVVSTHMEGQSNCRTLEELLDSLDPNMFWRAHRSYLVNIQRIKEVVPWFKSSYQIRMDDKKQAEIPVSRAQTKRLRELFNL
jgi:two-component system LytT family response regulator/two-component system response regulator LytT